MAPPLSRGRTKRSPSDGGAYPRSPRTWTASRIQLAGLVIILLGCASIVLRSDSLIAQRDDIKLTQGYNIRSEDRYPTTVPTTTTTTEDRVEEEEIPERLPEAGAMATTSPPEQSPLPTIPTQTEPIYDETTPPQTEPATTTVPVRTEIPTIPSSDTTPAPQKTPFITMPVSFGSVKATQSSTTPPMSPEQLQELCYNERDFGLVEQVTNVSKVFCAEPYDAAMDATSVRTKVTYIDAPASTKAVVFQNLLLDLTSVRPYKPIRSMAQDGGGHDPRFMFHPRLVYCACDEFQQFMAQAQDASPKRELNVWHPALYFRTKQDQSDSSVRCGGPNKQRPVWQNASNLVEIKGKAILIARRDDHNPFFQVSNALNAWIVMKALDWEPADVTVVHLDGGYPSPVDDLHKKLLSPSHEIVRGRDLRGKGILFSDEVMLAPFETNGPMMEHLDDSEPCHASELMKTFREQALQAVEAVPTATGKITVTIISRRPYNGRKVQRLWLNEDDIVEQMQKMYTTTQRGTPIVIQSIDFVALTMQQQMQLMLDSDVVISMHGAGLVNVLWTRPGTLVVEIFPEKRKRWGYRNLCQFIGCDWHEFRGGKDLKTGTHANAADKIIPFDEWSRFFSPLFEDRITKIDTQPLKQDSDQRVAVETDEDDGQSNAQPEVANEFTRS